MAAMAGYSRKNMLCGFEEVAARAELSSPVANRRFFARRYEYEITCRFWG